MFRVCQLLAFTVKKNVEYNNIYFAKGQVNQKAKSPSKPATILEKKLRYKRIESFIVSYIGYRFITACS